MILEKKKGNEATKAKTFGGIILVLCVAAAYLAAYFYIRSESFYSLYGLWFDFDNNGIKFFIPAIISSVIMTVGYIIWFNYVLNDTKSSVVDTGNKKKIIGYGWQGIAIGLGLVNAVVSLILILILKVAVPFISPTFVLVWIFQIVGIFVVFACCGPLKKK